MEELLQHAKRAQQHITAQRESAARIAEQATATAAPAPAPAGGQGDGGRAGEQA